jgi:hypothetical protein
MNRTMDGEKEMNGRGSIDVICAVQRPDGCDLKDIAYLAKRTRYISMANVIRYIDGIKIRHKITVKIRTWFPFFPSNLPSKFQPRTCKTLARTAK